MQTHQDDAGRRLSALAGLDILDTPPEESFDDIARLAGRLCRTPIALISLVDENRQWFKARLGFDPQETPLEQSVCAYAVAADDLLVIPDLASDPRTIANPLVSNPNGIRFYAGAPLRVAGGICIGTLCVIDTAPRPDGLDADQVDALRTLAGQVSAQLELRRTVKDLDRAHRLAEHRKERLRFMFDSAPGFMALLTGPDHVFEIANPAYLAIVGDRTIIGRTVKDALPDAAAQGYVEILDAVYRSGKPYSTTGARFDVQDEAGRHSVERYLDFVYQPMEDEHGVVEGIFVEGFDVTQRVLQIRRQEALTELGDRLRDLDKVEDIAQAAAEIVARTIGASRAGFGTVNATLETVLIHPNWCSAGTAPVTGTHHFRDYGSFIEDLKAGATVTIADVTLDERTRQSAQALHGLGIGALVNVPVLEHGVLDLVVFAHFPWPRALTAEELDFIRQIGDRTQASIGRARAMHHQWVLNQELSHRLKNTLAMVQAIASRTLRPLADEEPVRIFVQRLHALASAHNVLLQQNWSGAQVADVVNAALSGVEAVNRLQIAGPPLHLGARVALSLSLMLHELGTNALKYGALSAPDGTVAISWTVEPNEGVDSFLFEWREIGGPPVAARTSRGFGMRLIEMGLIGNGGVHMDFQPSGLVTRLAAPLDRIGDL